MFEGGDGENISDFVLTARLGSGSQCPASCLKTYLGAQCLEAICLGRVSGFLRRLRGDAGVSLGQVELIYVGIYTAPLLGLRASPG